MVLGSVATGVMGGLTAAATALVAGHPMVMVLICYSVVGTLGTLSCAAFMAVRRDPLWVAED